MTRAASSSKIASTTCTSRKWLPEPSVPHWSKAAVEGAITHVFGLGAFQPPVCLGELKIAFVGQAPLDETLGPELHQRLQIVVRKVIFSASSNARRHVAKQLLHQQLQVRLHIPKEQVGTDDSDAAVDIESDPARRDDASFRWVRRCDSADAKAISPVNIRHGQARALNAGQKRNIRHLVQSRIVADHFQEFVIRIDQTVHAHAGFVTLWDAPAVWAHPLDRSVKTLTGHGSFSR
jgi:hypothetical protein